MKSKEEKLKERRQVLKAMTMVFQVSISAICPIILLLSVGSWLDGKYGNGGYWFTAIGVICGIYSAYRGCYYLIKDVWFEKEENNIETDSEQH